MSKEELFFEIYTARGVVMRAPVKSRERFVRERVFLDDLTAPRWGRRPAGSAISDPIDRNFFMLDDNELDAYSAFRHQMDAEFGAP